VHDVFEQEPALAEGLQSCPTVHIASASTWTRDGMATLAACNVAAVLQGQRRGSGEGSSDFLEGEVVPDRSPSILNAADLRAVDPFPL
jgi:hydroxypyruvate reductase 1